MSWTKKTATEKLNNLINEIENLARTKAFSAEHVRWRQGVANFLQDIFGEKSHYLYSFTSLSWKKEGSFIVGGPADPAGSFNPKAAIEKEHHKAYLEQLDTARGLLLSAKDELEEKGLNIVQNNPKDLISISPISALKKYLSKLYQEGKAIVGQAIDTQTIKKALKAQKFTDAQILNALRYIEGKGYLRGYSGRQDDTTVSITAEGIDWIASEELPKEKELINSTANLNIAPFNYFSFLKKMSNKIRVLIEEINDLPKTRINEYSNMIAHQLRTLLRLILIQWWEDINKKTIPKNKKAGLEDLIQYSINSSISNKLNGAKAIIKQLEEVKKYKTMTDNTIHDEETTVDSDDCAKYRANLKNIISSIYR